MNQMSAPELVSETRTDGVLTLTLGNPPAHPLSHAMISALHAALDRAAADPDTRVVLLHGPGRIFCAGHDMKEIKRHRGDPDNGLSFITELFENCAKMMLRLATLPKPTVARIDGIATAAGLQLAASCDVVFASDSATFQLPGVTNGGFCTTPAVAVSRAIPRKALMDLMLSGAVKDSTWALATGLVSRVVPADRIAAEVTEFTKELATRNPGPIAAGKAALAAHLDLPLAAAYAHATPVMIDHVMDRGRLEIEKDNKF